MKWRASQKHWELVGGERHVAENSWNLPSIGDCLKEGIERKHEELLVARGNGPVGNLDWRLSRMEHPMGLRGILSRRN